MNKTETFVELVCRHINYRPVRAKVKSDLTMSINGRHHDNAENAVDYSMFLKSDNPEETAAAINAFHHMPFNLRYGLAVWSALVTMIIYCFYPIAYNINRSVQGGGLFVLGTMMIFAMLNYMILKRGHFKFSATDVRDISCGFIIGAAISVISLFAASASGKYGFYPHFENVKILFFDSISLLPGVEVRTFGNEFFIWLFSFMVYAVSTGRSKDKSFAFAYNFGGFGNFGICTADKNDLDIDKRFYK